MSVMVRAGLAVVGVEAVLVVAFVVTVVVVETVVVGVTSADLLKIWEVVRGDVCSGNRVVSVVSVFSGDSEFQIKVLNVSL